MEDCLFCKIANSEISCDFVYEDEDIVAFKDIHPRAPVHLLLLPKKHIASLAETTEADIALLGKINFVAQKLAEQFNIDQSGYRLLTNCRGDSGQEVPHIHYHLIGGHFLGAFTEE